MPLRSPPRRASRWLVLLLAAACGSPPANGTPAATVAQLYAALDSAPVFGAPTEEELRRLAPLLAADLTELLRLARALRDAAATLAPGEKPPFADGALFTSLFEGASDFTVVRDSLVRDPRGVVPDDYADHLVTVRFTHAAPGDTARWEDQVLVTRSGNRWVVADVRYGGRWDFAAQGSLVGNLRAGIAPPTP